MSCYHPLKAWRIGTNPSGKAKYKITGFDVQYVGLRGGQWKEFYAPGFSADRYVFEYTEIPCGHCIGCRLDYSRSWADRLMMELTTQDLEKCWFVTLTYSNDHVPTSYFGLPETGEAMPSLSLRKRDVQLFFKRLRKAHPDDHIRYYLAGEYGPTTRRPHYHAIIYGLTLHDVVPFGKSELGFQYWYSPSLEDIWGLGYVGIGEVTWETCAYTARYVVSKLTGDEGAYYDMVNIERPFCVMSRRPGIASDFYDEHGWKDTYVLPSSKYTEHLSKPPRYFEKKYEIDDPDNFVKMKDQRRYYSQLSKRKALSATTLSYSDLLLSKEECKCSSLKKLKRSDL